MNDDAQQTIGALTTRLFSLPVGDYLSSEEFRRFARDNEVWDTWREYLRLAEDRPELYGGSVTRQAFSLFLYHIFHRRKGEFLRIFTGLLADFSRGISCELPVDGMRTELLRLGYSGQELDHALFIFRVREQVAETTEGCCPPEEDRPAAD